MFGLNNPINIMITNRVNIYRNMCLCVHTEWWARFRLFARILVGILFVSVGVYDFIKPGVENTGAGIDLR